MEQERNYCKMGEIIDEEYLKKLDKRKEIMILEWRWGSAAFGTARGIKRKYKTYNDFICCNRITTGVV